MPEETKPTIVALPATVGTGAGGAVKADGHPIVLHVVRPVIVIAVRAGKAFFDTMSGCIGLGGFQKVTGFDVIPIQAMDDWMLFAAGISASAGLVSIVRNVGELFTKLDQKYPTMTV